MQTITHHLLQAQRTPLSPNTALEEPEQGAYIILHFQCLLSTSRGRENLCRLVAKSADAGFHPDSVPY
jgi:hypothetical protein